MTAYEVGQRIQEYIRGALPIFEPMEMNYNGEICMLTGDLLLRNGAFTDPSTFPQAIQRAMAAGAMQFRFESPLHDAIEAQKGQKFMEMKGLIAEAIAMDKAAMGVPDVVTALREALDGIGVPAKWINSEARVQEIRDAQQEEVQTQAILQNMQAGADVAATLATAQETQAAVAP